MDRTERQKLGLSKWIKAGCRGTLEWATGVGKTRAGLMAIKLVLSKNPEAKVLVAVPTDNLKIQWMTALNKAGLVRDVDVEIFNSTIKVKKKIDFLVLDEVHRVPSDTFFRVFEQKTPKIILGLTATFSRLDDKHKVLDKYCPVCDRIHIDEAIKNKWLSPYKEYKVVLKVANIAEYIAFNEEFHDSFSVFGHDFNMAMKALSDIIYRRRLGKHLGLEAKVMDALVYSWNRALKGRNKFVKEHPKKIEITRKILDARPNCKAVTFSATIAQAEKIKRGTVIHSGKTKKKNRTTLAEFSAMSTGVLNTSKAIDEGTDIPGLNLAVVLSNTSSGTQKTQRIGRVIRYEEGKEAEVFTLVIQGTNEEKWFDKANEGKRYIEITEDELEQVLANKEIDAEEQVGQGSSLLFRL